jgi:hypothetical protein
MKRLKWIGGGLVVAVVAVVVAAYVALASLDLKSYRGTIEERIEAATGRDVQLTGDMDLNMGFTPGVVIGGMTFANADWGSRPHMVKVDRFEVGVSVLPLLTGDLEISRLVLIKPDILLETGPEGEGNWVLPGPKEEAGSDGGTPRTPDVLRVRIQDARLRYNDKQTGFDLNMTLDQARLDAAEGGLAITGEGTYQSVPFQLDGQIGALATLITGKGRYPVRLNADMQDSSLAIDGFLDQSGADVRPDVEIEAETTTLANLTALSGLPDMQLPDIGPASVQSRVRSTEAGYQLSGLQAELADSDLAGEATIDLTGERPSLSAELTSSTLDLRGFLQATGGGDGGDGGGSRLFPDTPLPFDLLRRADLDVRLKAGSVRLSKDFSAAELRLNATGEAGRLKISPLEAKVADGDIYLAMVVDAAASPADVTIDLDVGELDYGRVLRDLQVVDGVQGTFDVRANLNARGDSPHQIAGSLNGGLEIVGGEGRVENDLLETFGSGLGDLFAVWREEDDDLNLNCTVARFDAKQGVLDSRAILADTEQVSFGATGEIDLGQERLSLRVTPEAKQTSLMSLAVPVRISGPLLNPEIGPDPMGALKATAFVVGAAINPLAAVGALVVSSETTDENPCVAAIAKAREAGTGPVEGDANGGGSGGVGGFLEDMGESIDDALGAEGGGSGGGGEGNRFENRNNDR